MAASAAIGVVATSAETADAGLASTRVGRCPLQPTAPRVAAPMIARGPLFFVSQAGVCTGLADVLIWPGEDRGGLTSSNLAPDRDRGVTHRAWWLRREPIARADDLNGLPPSDDHHDGTGLGNDIGPDDHDAGRRHRRLGDWRRVRQPNLRRSQYGAGNEHLVDGHDRDDGYDGRG
jgi:hypothetical protein